VLIFFQPLVEVNPVVDASAPEFDAGNIERFKQRDANTQVCGSLLLAEESWLGKSQRIAGLGIVFHAAARTWRMSRLREYSK
jgi:hypothetical protein